MRGLERGRRLARRAVLEVSPRLGLDVVNADFYSPIPRVPDRSHPVWSKQWDFELDTDAQLDFIATELTGHLNELPAAFAPAVPHGFTVWNGQYQAGDAEVLYALIRHLRPQRVLELGSGFSTLVSASACVANARDGVETQLVAVDPDPRTRVPDDLPGLGRIEHRDARDVSLGQFEELSDGDILFVDTSHVVKLGSEVNWLVLEVLPRLASGVWVHFHDIFLPYEYPAYLLELGAYFNEQYLLHAFLSGNDDWEVRLALCAVYRRHRPRLTKLLPSLGDGPPDPRWADVVPAAFWLRHRTGR